PIVGVGTMCKRQHTEEALAVLRPLHSLGLRLHGFGFKIDGLRAGASALLASADSMAWSKAAASRPVKLLGCTHKHCGNCVRWALAWRQDVLKASEDGRRRYQPHLFV